MTNELLHNPTVLLILGSIGGGLLTKGKADGIKYWNRIRSKYHHSISIDQQSDLFRVITKYVTAQWPEECRSMIAFWNKSDKTTRPSYFPHATSFVIRYKGKRLTISSESQKMEKMDYNVGLYFNTIRIFGWRAKRDIDALIREAMKQYASSREEGSVGVFARHWDRMEEVNEIHPKPLKALVYKDDKGHKIKADIDKFLVSEEWYAKRGITYKRTYTLYGPPGTGKTSLILSLAGELGKDVYLIALDGMSSEESLVRAVASIPAGAIMVFEDIDRTLTKADFKLSISSILNVLDGPLTRKGMIAFMTTNHLDKIDPAILRDGRVDVKEEIPLAGAREVERYLELFYEVSVKLNFALEVSMCTIQEICIRNQSDCKAAVLEISNL